VKGAIVYYGKWGHLRSVAEMIIKGLIEQDHEVALLEAGTRLPEEMEFMIVGAPTKLGKLPSEVVHFVKREIDDSWKGKPFAAFSTGDSKNVKKGEPQAAELINDLLLSKGLIPVVPPYKAGVTSMKGPLAEGVMAEAYRFGLHVGEELHGEGSGQVTER
jgi:menaquinone-dependent protoporphyrinogen IX oxidase